MRWEIERDSKGCPTKLYLGSGFRKRINCAKDGHPEELLQELGRTQDGQQQFVRCQNCKLLMEREMLREDG